MVPLLEVFDMSVSIKLFPDQGQPGSYSGPEVLVLYRKSAFSEVDDRGRLFWRAFDKAT
jgi:hypothetical protein